MTVVSSLADPYLQFCAVTYFNFYAKSIFVTIRFALSVLLLPLDIVIVIG